MPSIYDYAKTDEQRQLMRFVFSSTEFGRPYLFPPDVPKDRVQFMRKAIADTVKSPELVAEAQRIKLDMTFRAPEHLERLVAQLYATPPDVIEPSGRSAPTCGRPWHRTGDAARAPGCCIVAMRIKDHDRRIMARSARIDEILSRPNSALRI